MHRVGVLHCLSLVPLQPTLRLCIQLTYAILPPSFSHLLCQCPDLFAKLQHSYTLALSTFGTFIACIARFAGFG